MLKTSLRRGRGRLQILTAQVSDGSGQISATWFNQPWLKDKLTPGTHVRLRGQQNRFGFAVRSFDLNGGSATADFAPVYPASEEVSAVKLRELVESALPLATDRPDPLPASLKAERGLPLRGDALVALHRPRSLDEAEDGRRRLAFDELLVLQLALARRAAEREEQVAAALPRARGADRALPRRAAVRADGAPGGGDRGDRRAISRGRRRCSGCSRATWAPARRSSRSTRSCGRSRSGARAR